MKKVSCHRMHQRGILMNMWPSLFCMALECYSTALLCQACCPSPAIWLSKCKDRKTPCKRGKEALVGCHCPHYTALHLTLTVLHWLTLSSWQIISLVKFNLNSPLTGCAQTPYLVIHRMETLHHLKLHFNIQENAHNATMLITTKSAK